MAATRKIALLCREIREWIAPPALEILLGSAECISEGSFDGPPGPLQAYLASIQLVIPLAASAEYLSGPLDAATARQLAGLLRTDPFAQEILQEVARAESERAAGCALYDLQVEIDVGHQADTLLVSMDVEAHVRPQQLRDGAQGPR
jgi:hypothetical protein